MTNPSPAPIRSRLLSVPGVILAGLIMMLLFAGLAGELNWIDRPLAKRLASVVFGGVLALAGNYLPKLVFPTGALTHAGRTVSADRFAGRVFFLAGLAVVITSLIAPIGDMLIIVAAIGIGAFVIAGFNWLRLAQAGSSGDGTNANSETTASFNKVKAQRMAIFLILNALFWTFLIFIADRLWGDMAAQWMLVPFIIVNSLLAITQMRLVQKARGQGRTP